MFNCGLGCSPSLSSASMKLKLEKITKLSMAGSIHNEKRVGIARGFGMGSHYLQSVWFLVGSDVNAHFIYWALYQSVHINIILRGVYIIPLKPEPAMSTSTYDPIGTELIYKSKLFLCKMGHRQKCTSPVLALRGRYDFL